MSKKKKAKKVTPLDALVAAKDGDPRKESWGVLMIDTTSGLGEASLHWYRTPAQLVRGVAAALAELADGSPSASERKVRARLGAPPWTSRAMRNALSDNESWSTVPWVGRYADLAGGKSRWARALRAEFHDERDEEGASHAARGSAAILPDESEAFVDWLWESGAGQLCDCLESGGA